ncbi:hypothetical protein AAHA48_14420 [Dickeya oryzae]|uniref:hypothetical protein n=1 Tax=Dickeya oryzae TaxID=1240404 RepID=UPI0031631A87
MSDIDLVNQLSEEVQKLFDAKQNYDFGKRSLLNWIERDIDRNEGSERQEALRDRDYDSLREDERSAKDAFDHQKAIVTKLAEQLKDS